MMRSVLRLTLLLATCLVLLVFASVLLGQSSDSLIAAAYYEYEGDQYIVYVEDLSRHMRIMLAGKFCFDELPDWISPRKDREPGVGPIPGASTFLVEVIQDLREVLTRCRP